MAQAAPKGPAKKLRYFCNGLLWGRLREILTGAAPVQKAYLHVFVGEDSLMGVVLNFLLHAEIDNGFLDDVLIVSESVLLV